MEETLHLFITNNCRHNCPQCCNKFYEIDKIPVVTVELLKSVQTVCLTGGEPFFIRPERLKPFIVDIRNQYRNIKNLYIYTSGKELGKQCGIYKDMIERSSYIDGINISPKDWEDWKWFGEMINFSNMFLTKTKSNRLYVFKDQKPLYEATHIDLTNINIQVIDRVWESTFNTPANEHFARLPILF